MPKGKLEGADLVFDQVAKAKSPTDVFKEFSEWLAEHGVKVTPANLQIGNRLYHEFQRVNREAGGARAKSATVSSAPKPAAKAKAKPVSDEAQEADAKVATPNKKPVARRGVAKPAAKPASAPRSGRRGKVASAEEAPY